MLDKISFICVQLIVIITPLVFYTGTKDNFLIKETVFTISGLLLALIWILKIFPSKGVHSDKGVYPDKKEQQIKNTWLGFPLILYLLAILLSIVNAAHSQLVFEFLLFWIILTSIYFTVRRFSEKDSSGILNTLIVVAFIVTIYGLLQYLGLDPVNWLYSFGGRTFSSFGNPNFFSGYLLLVFPLVFAKMVSTREIVKHSFWMIFCFLIVFNLGIARTRGAWLAFFISILVLFIGQTIYLKIKFNTIKRMVRGSFWFFLLFFALFLISIDRFETLKSFFSKKDASVSERIFKWKTGREMIKAHPVLGVGAGNLKVNFSKYQAKVKRNIQLKSTSESNLHNEFLQRFAETGILGLLTFLSIFFCFFYYCVKSLYRKINSEESEFNMLLGIFTGVVSVFVYSLTNFPLSVVPVAATVFVLFGIAESSKEKNLQQVTEKHTSPVAFVALLIIFVLLMYITVIPRVRGDFARKKGDIAVASGDLQSAIGEYEKSIKLDYYHSERTAYDLGEVYRNLHQYDKAIESYKISVDLRNYGEVYNNIGNCYYIKKDFERAIENWKIATRLGLPDDNDQKTTLSNIKKVTYKLKQRNH